VSIVRHSLSVSEALGRLRLGLVRRFPLRDESLGQCVEMKAELLIEIRPRV
jgi:hypothetical protein